MDPLLEVPSEWDTYGNRFRRNIGRYGLKMLGWQLKGTLPAESKLVFAIGPHTSNWDFLVGLLTMFALDIKVNWLGKSTIFAWPVKNMFVRWGGVPVHRDAPAGFVEEVASLIKQRERLHIAIAPEGTRSKTGRLKTGFLRIALAADIPVLRISIDFPSKTILFGDLFYPTGDIEKDERNCYAYFQKFTGKIPGNY